MAIGYPINFLGNPQTIWGTILSPHMACMIEFSTVMVHHLADNDKQVAPFKYTGPSI